MFGESPPCGTVRPTAQGRCLACHKSGHVLDHHGFGVVCAARLRKVATLRHICHAYLQHYAAQDNVVLLDGVRQQCRSLVADCAAVQEELRARYVQDSHATTSATSHDGSSDGEQSSEEEDCAQSNCGYSKDDGFIASEDEAPSSDYEETDEDSEDAELPSSDDEETDEESGDAETGEDELPNGEYEETDEDSEDEAPNSAQEGSTAVDTAEDATSYYQHANGIVERVAVLSRHGDTRSATIAIPSRNHRERQTVDERLYPNPDEAHGDTPLMHAACRTGVHVLRVVYLPDTNAYRTEATYLLTHNTTYVQWDGDLTTQDDTNHLATLAFDSRGQLYLRTTPLHDRSHTTAAVVLQTEPGTRTVVKRLGPDQGSLLLPRRHDAFVVSTPTREHTYQLAM